MIELPPSLHRWREELSIFPRDIALTIGAWLPRLHLAFGPLAAKSEKYSGEVDGFGGITRRGPYERLLVSEWLMALEYPEEFSRRAAMHEHAFLEVARREPQGSRRSVVLLDSGPTQLGSPRIFHLAALIILARRAWSQNAEFGWGVLQDPSGWRWAGLTESSVLGLLESRSVREATSIDLEDWLERIEETETETDDLWIIGHKKLAELGAQLPPKNSEKLHRASRLEVEEVLELDRRAVRFDLIRRGRKPTALELELPEETACIRLLRDPFEIKPPPISIVPRRHHDLTTLVFSKDSRKLLVRSGADEIIALHPPHDPRGQAGTTRRLSTFGEPIAAAGSVERAFYAVTSNSKRIAIRHFSKKGESREIFHFPELAPDFPFWHPGENTPLQPCFFWCNVYIFLDPVGRAICLDPVAKTVKMLHSDITGIGQVGGKIWLVQNAWGSGGPTGLAAGRRLLSLDTPEEVNLVQRFEGTGDLAAFFGYPPGMVAVRQNEDTWSIFHEYTEVTIEPPKGSRVFGLTSTLASGRARALLVVESDQRTISAVTDVGTSRIHIAPERIISASASSRAPLIAWMEETGAVTVFSLEKLRPVQRLLNGQEPEANT
jgi:hypothetical protein